MSDWSDWQMETDARTEAEYRARVENFPVVLPQTAAAELLLCQMRFWRTLTFLLLAAVALAMGGYIYLLFWGAV